MIAAAAALVAVELPATGEATARLEIPAPKSK